MKPLEALGVWVVVIAVVCGLGLLLGFPIKWCWNATIAEWGGPTITWGQAWCLYFLSTLLVKSNLTCNHKE